MGVSIIEKEKYFYVKMEGDTLAPQQIAETIQAVTEQCTEKKKHALIHRITEARQVASMTNFYEFSQYLEERWIRTLRIAMVYPASMIQDQIDFFEVASQNRGINLKLFSSFEEAESWIKSS
jgi:hypothetical protein